MCSRRCFIIGMRELASICEWRWSCKSWRRRPSGWGRLSWWCWFTRNICFRSARCRRWRWCSSTLISRRVLRTIGSCSRCCRRRRWRRGLVSLILNAPRLHDLLRLLLPNIICNEILIVPNHIICNSHLPQVLTPCLSPMRINRH